MATQSEISKILAQLDSAQDARASAVAKKYRTGMLNGNELVEEGEEVLYIIERSGIIKNRTDLSAAIVTIKKYAQQGDDEAIRWLSENPMDVPPDAKRRKIRSISSPSETKKLAFRLRAKYESKTLTPNPSARGGADGSISPWWILGGAAAIGGVVYAATRKRSKGRKR